METISKRPRPIVALATDALRSMIREGRYRAGQMIDSEHGLAEMLAVSRGTVRQAIEVLVATGELTRQPHSRPVVGLPKDRPSGSGQSDVFVWVSHPISDNASLMFLRGVSLGLMGTPYRMTVREPTRFFGDHVRSDERQFLADLSENETAAGAIVQRDPCTDNAEVINGLLQAGMPLVFVDSPPPDGVSADYVGSANVAAARQCVEHLIELGHRRIACLVESDVPQVTQQRIRGFWRAMRNAGLESEGTCLIANRLPARETSLRPAGRFAGRCAVSGAFAEWSHKLVSAVLEMSDRPTALFVGCDVLAHSVGALLEGAGIRIPEDLSLAGFDWLARWETASTDDLTTVSQDFEGFGRYAADLLLDRLSGEAPHAPRHVLLPAALVVRSSTATRPVLEPALDLTGDDALFRT